jgi:catechol 2,3-dioxygenase-like lactoylglutathione lyase family enzyme
MKTQSLVPMMAVVDVERSIEFYSHLGFEVGNTFTPDRATKPAWAWLQSGDAQLMLSAASESIAGKHTVLFYVYTDDVAAAHAALVDSGLNPGPIATPFYAPRGEFEIIDPDGYVVMVTHTGDSA